MKNEIILKAILIALYGIIAGMYSANLITDIVREKSIVMDLYMIGMMLICIVMSVLFIARKTKNDDAPKKEGSL